MGMRLFILGAYLGLVASPRPVAAQKGWTEIGRTSAGNVISYDKRSVKTSKGITSAMVQVKFTKPVAVGKDRWYLSRHDVMFDCGKRTVASKSNVYYGDAGATKVVKRDVIKIPGF